MFIYITNVMWYTSKVGNTSLSIDNTFNDLQNCVLIMDWMTFVCKIFPYNNKNLFLVFSHFIYQLILSFILSLPKFMPKYFDIRHKIQTKYPQESHLKASFLIVYQYEKWVLIPDKRKTHEIQFVKTLKTVIFNILEFFYFIHTSFLPSLTSSW